jgi:hypothetical protein
LPVPRSLIALAVLALVIVAACGGDDDPIAELQSVASVEPGAPVLAFVYTDG